MEMIEKPRPEEREIICNWNVVDGKVISDPACERIESLTYEYLEKIGADASGWDTLFRDPEDGRYWERIYPLSHMHGGGPPTLLNIAEEEARIKHAHLFD